MSKSDPIDGPLNEPDHWLELPAELVQMVLESDAQEGPDSEAVELSEVARRLRRRLRDQAR